MATTKKQDARARLQAERAEQARRERRVKFVIYGVTGVLVIGLGGMAAWALWPKPAAPLPAASSTLVPPWPVPADSVARAKQVGLEVNQMEGTAQHFHVHLDILDDGKPVTIPANLGIDGTGMSEMHTHDTRGVIHIESPSTGKKYHLGQVFQVWGLHFAADGIGGLKTTGGKTLRVFVNGTQVTTDPAAIELKSHQEIALVYGDPAAKTTIPSSYAFQTGE
ncbi:MAG: hypothetical protein JWN00_4464 [Actinomycetia bacterium]|nr:hypothetical protein [Actinomycetes bacterium]